MVMGHETTRDETLTASPRSAVVPDLVDTSLSEENLTPEIVEPEKVNKKGKKRAVNSLSVSSGEWISAEAQSDEPPKKKTKKKKKKKSVEEQIEPDEVVEDLQIVVHDGSGNDATAWTEGGSSGSPAAPLERKKRKKQSVDHYVSASIKRDDFHASKERGGSVTGVSNDGENLDPPQKGKKAGFGLDSIVELSYTSVEEDVAEKSDEKASERDATMNPLELTMGGVEDVPEWGARVTADDPNRVEG
ncbi:hypothetical protein F2Q70_00038677 [Brassica cretica]|uniref:Uncharacterized protein n=1 Tax=Brassica cretica TaxID=69181 RepID=A0A8S9K7T0_BRACR|nr:hypothetical protein F2Q70_00038677 [Brassica cretica]